MKKIIACMFMVLLGQQLSAADMVTENAWKEFCHMWGAGKRIQETSKPSLQWEILMSRFTSNKPAPISQVNKARLYYLFIAAHTIRKAHPALFTRIPGLKKKQLKKAYPLKQNADGSFRPLDHSGLTRAQFREIQYRRFIIGYAAAMARRGTEIMPTIAEEEEEPVAMDTTEDRPLCGKGAIRPDRPLTFEALASQRKRPRQLPPI